MKKLVQGYFRLVKVLIVSCLVLMVVLVFTNVVLRYAFGSGITVSEELSRWLFVYLSFLGAIVALHERLHLGVDILLVRMPAGIRRLCALICYLLMLWATWLVIEGSWIQTQINWSSTAPATGFSMGILYASGLVFSASAAVILLHQAWQVIAAKEPAPDIAANVPVDGMGHTS